MVKSNDFMIQLIKACAAPIPATYQGWIEFDEATRMEIAEDKALYLKSDLRKLLLED